MTTLKKFLETLTEEQRSSIKEFRCRFEGLLNSSHDDYYLWKWLKSRSFNLDKAEKRLREHLKFRRNLGADTIIKDYVLPEVVAKYHSFYFAGFSKKSGDAVICHMPGITDIKGLVSSLTSVDVYKSLVYIFELVSSKIKERNEKENLCGGRLILIYDLEGLSMRQIMDLRVGKYAIDIALTYEANYPESLRYIYFLNVPSFFHRWANMLKKLLDAEIVSKIKIFGKDGWQDDLFEVVDPKIIPIVMGGDLVDPERDEFIGMTFKVESTVPSSYYLKSECWKLNQDPTVTKTVIRERIYFNHVVEIKVPESSIRWYFQTLDYNIGFAVYYVPSGVKPMPKFSTPKYSKSFRHKVRRNSRDGHKVIVPLERVESHHIPEQGEIVCELAGTYMFHFDNTFSWVRPKELYYKVEVRPPAETTTNGQEDMSSLKYSNGLNDKCLRNIVL